MSSRFLTTESRFLERTRVALSNAASHQTIQPLLADYGMDATKLAEGQALYESTLAIWEQNKQEQVEGTLASTSYKSAYSAFEELFKRHRYQTQLFFKKQPELLIALGITGRFPRSYTDLFNKAKQFYTTIQTNADLQTQMSRIKITPEVVAECLAQHSNLLNERATYDKEFGESQDATKSKNAALNELDEWMEDFDAIAQIALFDQPQLLEVLGIFVRS